MTTPSKSRFIIQSRPGGSTSSETGSDSTWSRKKLHAPSLFASRPACLRGRQARRLHRRPLSSQRAPRRRIAFLVCVALVQLVCAAPASARAIGLVPAKFLTHQLFPAIQSAPVAGVHAKEGSRLSACGSDLFPCAEPVHLAHIPLPEPALWPGARTRRPRRPEVHHRSTLPQFTLPL